MCDTCNAFDVHFTKSTAYRGFLFREIHDVSLGETIMGRRIAFKNRRYRKLCAYISRTISNLFCNVIEAITKSIGNAETI